MSYTLSSVTLQRPYAVAAEGLLQCSESLPQCTEGLPQCSEGLSQCSECLSQCSEDWWKVTMLNNEFNIMMLGVLGTCTFVVSGYCVTSYVLCMANIL